MSDVQNSLNRMARWASILLLGTITSKLVNYGYRAYLARTLSVSDYGILNLGIMIITIIAAISTIGMENGLNRYIPYYLGLKENIKATGVVYFSGRITLMISIVFSIVLYALSNRVAGLFDDSEILGSLLKALSISLPFVAVGQRIFLNCLLFFNYPRQYSLIFNVLQSIGKVLFTIFLISLGFGLFGAGIAYTINSVAVGIISVYIFHSKVGIKKMDYSAEKKDFLSYSFPLFLVTIIAYINGWVDTFMVGYLLDNYNVGLYNAALLISQLLYLFPSILLPLVMPIIGPHFARKEYANAESLAKRVTKWIFIINIFVSLVLFAYPGTIIRIIFGTKYFSSTLALIILSIGSFTIISTSLLLSILELHRRTRLILLNITVAFICNVVLNLIFTPRYGIAGTALATTISNSAIALLLIVENYVLFRTNVFSLAKIKILLVAVIPTTIIFLSKMFFTHRLFTLGTFVFLAMVTYIVILLKAQVLDKADIDVMLDLKSKIVGYMPLIKKYGGSRNGE